MSREIDGIKLVSTEPLKKDGSYIVKAFNSNDSSTAYFLNHDYLNPSNGYLISSQVDMIENTFWYSGVVDFGQHYKLAKYTSENGTTTINNKTETKVGLLRLGE